MDGKTFNRSAAKAAGYSDAEIDAFLASRQSTPSAPKPRQTAGVPAMSPAESTGVRRQTPTTLSERVQTAQRRENMQAVAERQLQSIPAFLANISRDIPGAEAAQAGIRSVARGQPYREALGDIRQATDALPTVARVAPRIAGAALAGAAIPASVAMRLPLFGRVSATVAPTAARQAALFGAASGLTEASPDVRVGERVGRALGQAALGGTVAKGAQVAGTVARSIRTPSRAAQLIAGEEATEQAASPLYREFRAMGELPETPALQEILELPIVRTAVRTVKKESPRLAKLPDTDAQVLDAVYKRVGSRAFTAKHGFEPGEAREALLNAIDDAAVEKMAVTGQGTLYSNPVGTFRRGSELMGATQRGAQAFQRAGTPTGGTTVEAALEESPEALARWARTASPEERQAAISGILAGVRQRGAADVMTPFGVRGGFSLLPGVRRAANAADVIAEIERMMPRTPVRRTAEAFLPTFLTPRDRSIPTEP